MNSTLAAVAGTTIALGSLTCAAFAQPAATKDQPKASGLAAPKVDLTKPTLYTVGYAHLDTQWRWTYVDTIREFIPNTLTRNFALFEKYPGYVFNFSGSRRYRMMEEYYPADYEKLKGYVAQGKWFPCGSSVDENDANVPSAESLVRQVLYGNKYFREKFGIASDEYMLPDCFGFPAALPSALAHCGLKGFSTQKLTWNAVVPIPFKVGFWEGPDGRGIISALDPGEYVGDVRENLANSETWLTRINANGKLSGAYVDYHYFGVGDQGGAPKEPTVALVQQSTETKGSINVISSQADWMFQALTPEIAKNLPRYKGELELIEHSAGSVTSQAYMKRWNRKNELLADSAERAAIGAWWLGARDYPAQKIEDAWYLVLGSQMHDILPGTSVPRAYDLSWNDEVIAGNQFAQVLEDSAGVIISAIDTRAKGTPLVVFNPLSIEREDVVEAEIPISGPVKGVKVSGPDGKHVAAQILSTTSQSARIAILAKAPSVGFAAYDVEFAGESTPMESGLKVQERQLENASYVVKLDDNGDVSSIFDKRAGREVLRAPIRIGLHYENPRAWPAWNQDWADRQLPVRSYAGGPATFKVVENGPARVAVEVTREAEGSTFVQRIRLSGGEASGRIEFDTDIDWRTKERSVRVAFPLAVANASATYDIQTGVIERGNGHPKQYEYPFHQWFDLTDVKGDYGATVMSDSKFGSDKPDDNTVRLTLLHTPGTRGGYPDQGTQDIGRHHVLYAFAGHAGDWRKGASPAQASRLNQPLVPFVATSHEGVLGKTFSLARSSDPNVVITAIKKAEASDEVIVRLRELSGSTAKGVRIAFASPVVSAREVDGQEREIGTAAVADGQLGTDVHGYGLKAFALKLGPAPAKVAKIESATVALSYDADVVSTNSNRAGGSFNSQGASLPAEQFPAELKSEGVLFKLGSAADGQKNALTCKGQEISIPGGHDTLYVLAAAEQDVDAALKVGGKSVPWRVQAWSGMIGQWDRRLWSIEVTESQSSAANEVIGLEPGYIKPDAVAWNCSHHHTPKGDAIYEYCYIFKYAIPLPTGVTSITLPDDPRIKVFAASVAKTGPARAAAAHPLFDTLSGHAQDAPRITGGGKTYSDATQVSIEPGLYWRRGDIRYTTDGTQPGANSAVYHGPLSVAATTTMKAALVDAAGRAGPVATAKIEVNDKTAPTVVKASAVSHSPAVLVEFSEPVDASAVGAASKFTFEPALAVQSATLAEDGRSLVLTLAAPPKSGQQYRMSVSGVKDRSPSANTIQTAAIDLNVAAPVFEAAEVSTDMRGTVVRDVKGLPIKGSDPWTINAFVRSDKQVPNRTIIAGFGKCEDKIDGAARYLTKFANGIHFWVRNRDVEGRTPLELNKWQMLTATYDGKTLRLYKDGRQIGERTVPLADDENVIHITPKDPWDQRRQFEGDIRAFTVWSGALSEEAIRSLMAGTKLPN